MKLRFFNNEDNASGITVKGKCVITNYDTRTRNHSNADDLTMIFNGNNSSRIAKGTNIFIGSSTVDMEKIDSNKSSIFSAIAGDDGELTQSDLDNAVNDFRSKNEKGKSLLNLGVVQIRYDKEAGVATIVMGNNDILRIDFETEKEATEAAATAAPATEQTATDNSTVTAVPVSQVTEPATESTNTQPSASSSNNNTTIETPILEDSKPSESRLLIPGVDYDPTRLRAIVGENGEPIREIIHRPYQSYNAFVDALAQQESSGRATEKNEYGYVGLFQMGEAVMIDLGIYSKRPDRIDKKGNKYYNNNWSGNFSGKYGITSLDDFLNDENKQKEVLSDLMRMNWEKIHKENLTEYIGEVINGQVITAAGLLAGAHLLGVNNLKLYLESDGRINPKDGNKKHISEYIEQFAFYNMYDITGCRPGIKPPPKKYINIEYTVKDGDNLSNIAQFYGTTVQRIKEASGIQSNHLRIGQKLTVPVSEEKYQILCPDETS